MEERNGSRKTFYHEVNALASSMKSQNDAVNIKNDIEPVQEQQKTFQIAKFRDVLNSIF